MNYTNNDELIHWKYTSKKKINGKWRYYYGNEEVVPPTGEANYIPKRDEGMVKRMGNKADPRNHAPAMMVRLHDSRDPEYIRLLGSNNTGTQKKVMESTANILGGYDRILKAADSGKQYVKKKSAELSRVRMSDIRK